MLAELSFERALGGLAGTPPVMYAIVSNLPRSAQDEHPSEGGWSPRQVLAHLLFAETVVMDTYVAEWAYHDLDQLRQILAVLATDLWPRIGPFQELYTPPA